MLLPEEALCDSIWFIATLFQSVGGKTLYQVEAVPPFWNRVKIMKNRGRIFFSELELIHDGHTVWVGNKTLYYKLLKFWVWVHNINLAVLTETIKNLNGACLIVVTVVQSFSRVQLFVTHGLQHTRLPCPSSSPRVCSNSHPLSQWCHPVISASVIPFPSCLQSFPASGSFPIRQLFSSAGQSTGASASTSNKCSGLISFRID